MLVAAEQYVVDGHGHLLLTKQMIAVIERWRCWSIVRECHEFEAKRQSLLGFKIVVRK